MVPVGTIPGICWWRITNEDDLIIVKLDIDTPSVEMPLVQQLLHDARLYSLVDHFYFEHHVHMREIAVHWRASMTGSIKESLEMFQELRRKGISSHFWI